MPPATQKRVVYSHATRPCRSMPYGYFGNAFQRESSVNEFRSLNPIMYSRADGRDKLTANTLVAYTKLNNTSPDAITPSPY